MEGEKFITFPFRPRYLEDVRDSSYHPASRALLDVFAQSSTDIKWQGFRVNHI